MLGLWYGDLIPCLLSISWFMLDLCFQVCHRHPVNFTQLYDKSYQFGAAAVPRHQEQRAHDGKGPDASLARHDQWRDTNQRLPSGPGWHQHADEPRCHGADPWHDGRGSKFRPWKFGQFGIDWPRFRILWILHRFSVCYTAIYIWFGSVFFIMFYFGAWIAPDAQHAVCPWDVPRYGVAGVDSFPR